MPVFKLSVYLNEPFDNEKHRSLIKCILSSQNLYEWSVLVKPFMIELVGTKKLNTYWTMAWAPKRVGKMTGDYDTLVLAYNVKELDYPLDQLQDGYELYAMEGYNAL